MSGCHPCYNSGTYPFCGYNTCNPCNQKAGSTTLIIGGCICVENTGVVAAADASDGAVITLTITANCPCTTQATYKGNHVSRKFGDINGGGALFNISQGGCTVCGPNCNCNYLNLTATLSSLPSTITQPAPLDQVTQFVLIGECGDTLTAQSNEITLTLDTIKECCGDCTTCTIKSGKISLNLQSSP